MRHGLAGELPDTPRFACAAHTTYHDRGAHEGAHVCPFAFWRDTVLRAGSRISRRTLTLERIHTKQSPQIPRPRNGRISTVWRTHC